MNRNWYYLGIAIIIIGIFARQPLLLIVGVLVILVVGTADIWAKFCLRHLHYQRQFSERRVLFGEEITLSISIENAKLLPLPWLEVEDNVPAALSYPGRTLRYSLQKNRAVIDNLFSPRWYERVTRHYTVLCNARGVHAFGPTELRSGDIFGFITRDVKLPNWQYLLVYPLVVPLTRFSLPARHPFGDRRAQRRLLEDPSRVIGVRDYAYGDSLRRVHWKASARAMQLQSKVYESTTTYTLAIFLNVPSLLDANYDAHPELQELTICASASVADWAIDQGYAVGLYTNTLLYMPEEGVADIPVETEKQETEQSNGLAAAITAHVQRRRIHLPPASSDEQRKRIMEALARIQAYFGSSIEDVLQSERSHLPAGATVVVVTSAMSDFLLDTLARVKRAGHDVAILFAGNGPLPTKVSGITVYHLGGDQTWQELMATHESSGASSSDAVAGSKEILPKEAATQGFRL